MSANETLRTARRLRYRRLRRPVQKRGVSPVVATLILILIAVAAAAALYLWLVGWQGSVTGTIGKPGVNTGSFTIGGSTSVFPFSQLAVTQYEQNNTGATISLTQGGTGAGMLAVCSGQIDVGEASSLQTSSSLISTYGCPQADANSITITTVAYDAVDMIVQLNNPHGLISVSSDTLYAIYFYQSTTVPTINYPATINTNTTAALDGGTINGVSNSTSGTTYYGLAWDQIPAAVSGATFGHAITGGPNYETQASITVGAGINCASSGTYADDICPEAAGKLAVTGATPCGWSVCAGPWVSTSTTGAPAKGITGIGTDPIITVQRSDTSGTTQAFTARLLGLNKVAAPVTTLTALAGDFNGCGSDGQLGSCGIAATQGENGNPGVITYVAATKDALGYASDGLTRVSTSGVTCQGVATAACGIGFEGIGQTSAVYPSLGSTGTIAAAITDPSASGSAATTGEYMGWRPFLYVTLAPPTGLVESYIAWLLQPGVNTAIATEAAEVSIYSI